MKKLLTDMFEYRILNRIESNRIEHTYAKKLEGGAAI